MSLSLTPHQINLITAYRSEYVNSRRNIDAEKENVKEGIAALVDGLKWDTKEMKEEIKALKKSMEVYYKETLDSEVKMSEDVVVLASL